MNTAQIVLLVIAALSNLVITSIAANTISSKQKVAALILLMAGILNTCLMVMGVVLVNTSKILER